MIISAKYNESSRGIIVYIEYAYMYNIIEEIVFIVCAYTQAKKKQDIFFKIQMIRYILFKLFLSGFNLLKKYPISGFFCVSQNLRKLETSVTFLICVNFWDLKSFLYKMIKDIISAYPIICNFRDCKKEVIRSSRKLAEIR